MKYTVKFKKYIEGKWIKDELEQDNPYVDLRCGMDGKWRMHLYSERDRFWYWEPVKDIKIERKEQK